MTKLKIYTRTGDKGLTSLYGGKRISKNSLKIDSIGAVDELNAVLGVLIYYTKNRPEISRFITGVQSDLFAVGAALAGDKISHDFLKKRVEVMEKFIDRLDSGLPELKNFILPGGSPAGANAHLARTFCRRAERQICTLPHTGPIGSAVLVYLNRLSDLLFVVARYLNHKDGIPETIWKK